MWTDRSMIESSGIHNPVNSLIQANEPVLSTTALDGEVWVTQGTSDPNKFTINANTAGDDDENVYTESLTAHK
jgi:hypothetical protein